MYLLFNPMFAQTTGHVADVSSHILAYAVHVLLDISTDKEEEKEEVAIFQAEYSNVADLLPAILQAYLSLCSAVHAAS